MYLSDYMDTEQLSQHVDEGLVDVRYHKSLPLKIFSYSKKAIHETAWDEITTKCRGLIVDNEQHIISRPFEKFFNLETSYRPETHLLNLPTTQPVVSEKLDGSLGILYQYTTPNHGHKRHHILYSGIATKGSFHSDQATWATNWYHMHCPKPFWPEGYTVVFEIIAESVQHHVVHYHGHERLVLLAIIHNRTGEELPYSLCGHYARVNDLEMAPVYTKTLEAILKEDRPNAEGYVVSWPRSGNPPFKIKVKHESFLDLQRVVHAATPKAILEALESGNVNLLDTWIGQTNEPIGRWVSDWVAKLNGKYGELLFRSNNAYRHALSHFPLRKDFAEHICEFHQEIAPVCFAMLDDKEYRKIIWRLVERHFEKELSQPFTVQNESEE